MILQVVLISLVVVLIAVAVYLICYEKIFAKFKPDLLRLEVGTIVYAQYQGNYHKMMDFVNSVKADFRSFCEAEGFDFNKFAMVGVYYDDPAKIVDITKGRAIIGLLLRKGDTFSTQRFLSHPTVHQYKTISHGRLTAFGAHFPLVGVPSLLSAIFRGYPAIKRFGSSRKLMEKCVCSYEVYEWGKKKLSICFPYGEDANKKLTGLSGASQPEYKK
jgi:hypothetical protein